MDDSLWINGVPWKTELDVDCSIFLATFGFFFVPVTVLIFDYWEFWMYFINDFVCVICMWMYMGVNLFDMYSLGYTSEVGFLLFNLQHCSLLIKFLFLSG
jgi:putative effector of murein hydrolase LrgA (UPF0299 family)